LALCLDPPCLISEYCPQGNCAVVVSVHLRVLHPADTPNPPLVKE